MEVIKLKVDTAQEAFDAVTRHLSQMEHQATGSSKSGLGTCMYLTPDGDRCAIGAILDLDDPAKSQWAMEAQGSTSDIWCPTEHAEHDEEYLESVWSNAHSDVDQFSQFPAFDPDEALNVAINTWELDGFCVSYGNVPEPLLEELQSIHDNGENWDETGFIGYSKLAAVAVNHGLHGDVVEQVRPD